MENKRYKIIKISFFISFTIIIGLIFLELILFFKNLNIAYILSYFLLAIIEAWCVFLAVFLSMREKINLYNFKYKVVLKEIEKERFDELTNLYNRDNFVRYSNRKIKHITPRNKYYMIQFDIDNFSVYNEFFGVDEGNQLLLKISQKIREFSTELGCVCGRLYNDVFVILVDGTLETVENIVEEIQKHTDAHNSKFNICLTFGIVEIKDKSQNAETILNHCKLAALKDKEKYDKTYCLYEDYMAKKEYKVQEVLNCMEYGLENKEFCIFLQPKYNIITNELIGAESLVRWKRNGEIIPPNDFVPIFEKNGFIIKLDFFVWVETLKYLKWRKSNGLKMIPISVNVSRKFLTIDKFAEKMLQLVNSYQIKPEYLELELTETIFSDITTTKNVVAELRQYGFKVLMDDFGSGYSSLNVLKDVDFDILKIDLKFFSNTDDKSIKIIKEIINLSKILNIPTIAEGVETKEQVSILKSLDCIYAQGYFYSKPIDIESFNQI